MPWRAWMVGGLAAGLVLGTAAVARAEELEGWSRVDSLYCTVWVHPDVPVRAAERQLSVSMLRGSRVSRALSAEERLGAKCDAIFKAVERTLEMYPTGLRARVLVFHDPHEIEQRHAQRYGFGTEAEAFYVRENDSIYTTAGSLSTSVLAHEMAHSVMSHYFTVRPPRKIEELLAIHVDANLGPE